MGEDNKKASPSGNWPESYNTLWDNLLYYKSFTSLDEAILREQQADMAGDSEPAVALEVRTVRTE